MKVAIIGSGIAGLTVAHRLHRHAQITLYEANDYFGGHTHTVDVTLPDPTGQAVTWGVDTGFLVYNERTYPGLIALFAELGIPRAASTMSFSVQVLEEHGPVLEWGGASLGTLFADRRNLVRPGFWRMVADLLRFNRLCTQLAERGDDAALMQPLGDFLRVQRFSDAFAQWYLLPMLGSIWSCPTTQMLQFPVGTMIRFCHNHGLLQISDRPQWYTVPGGARQYVARIVSGIADARRNAPVRRLQRDDAGVTLWSTHGAERFDEVVIATHSDQALALLADPTSEERSVLGAIRYQKNRAVLHTDTRVMPKRRAVWSAWNYERAADAQEESQRVCLHYWLNALQPLPFAVDVIESLNPIRPIDPAKVLAEFDYAHPVFDAAAVAAQAQIPHLQGRKHTWYCGAWTGYGFHEDGLQSGVRVAEALQARIAAGARAVA
jgi:predicted NAD/FAD-binding protein